MSQRYAIPCSCGASVPVEIRQAGETVNCQCGKALDVPKLRDLRRLQPLAESQPVKRPASWSVLQGSLFVVGLCALVLSAGSAYYVWSYRQLFDTTKPDAANFSFSNDLMTITLSDSWDLWNRYSQLNIDQRDTPYHVLARGKVEQLDDWLGLWGILGSLGAMSLMASFVFRARTPR